MNTNRATVGRNDACPCNSGKKFKHCCQQKASPLPSGATDSAEQNLLLQRAIAQHKAGQLPAAEASYRRLLKTNSQHADANHNLGALLLLGYKQPAVSLPFFKAALQANPQKTQFWISYIEALVNADQFANAWTTISEAKRQGQKSPAFLSFVALQMRKLALKFSHNKDWPTTITCAKRGLEYASSDGQLWHCLGYGYLQMVRYEEAQQAFIRACEFSDDAHSWNHLGVAQLNLGQHEQARRSFQKSRELNPNLVSAWSNAAFNEHEDCQYHAIGTFAQRAWELDPTSEKANLVCGLAALRDGDLDSSKEFLRSAITSAMQHVRNLYKPTPSPMVVDSARTALKAARECLNEAGIDFFLSAGTLLGIVRDGDLLPHDKDMDIGILANIDRETVAQALTHNSEFVLNKSQVKSPDNWHWNFSVIHQATQIIMDIFFYHEDGDHYLCGFNAKPHPINSRPRHFGFSKLHWQELDWLVPSPPEQYLIDVYGPEWKIPDTGFDTALSNRCRTEGSKPTRAGYGYVKLYNAVSAGNWRKAAGLCGQILNIAHDDFIAHIHQQLITRQHNDNLTCSN